MGRNQRGRVIALVAKQTALDLLNWKETKTYKIDVYLIPKKLDENYYALKDASGDLGKEERKNEERQNMLAQMSEEKRKMLLNLDLSLPVDELPDCE